MKQYHKIENIFDRDIVTNNLIEGKYRSDAVAFVSSLDWLATEKIDGTNIRILWDGESISFNGKTDNANLSGDLVKKLQEMFLGKKDIFVEKFGEKKVCFYGEGYGAGIQKGGMYSPTKEFILFDVWIDEMWLERGNVEGIAEVFGMKVVPIVEMGSLTDIVNLVKAGIISAWGDFICEGVVVRPVIELKDRFGNRVITKIKTKDFR